MCATAISFARVRRLYYAAPDAKGGGVEHGPRIYAQPTCHHRPDVYSGIAESESAALLRDFFRSEEHTSELQSLMRISYAVFCLKTKKTSHIPQPTEADSICYITTPTSQTRTEAVLSRHNKQHRQ